MVQQAFLDTARVAFIQWNARDRTGNAIARGVYFVRLQAANAASTRKLVRVHE